MPPDDDAAAQAAAAKATADAAAAKATQDAADAAKNDTGSFPANTPLEQMTVEQREAYWKHQSRKHEERSKAFAGFTPEQLVEMKAKADKHDALELELGSEADKKAAAARTTALAEADQKYQPALVKAEFKAAAAGRIEPERLDTILEPLNMSAFLAADGTVDADKVKTFVDGIAPVTGNQQQRRGPSPTGMGNRGDSKPGPSVSAGRDLYRTKHPAKQ